MGAGSDKLGHTMLTINHEMWLQLCNVLRCIIVWESELGHEAHAWRHIQIKLVEALYGE